MGAREQSLVLLLDDDELWARSLTRGLAARGLNVRSYVDIASARAALERDLPDLCVIDYSLARGENGADFARGVWEAFGKQTPPLVLMSGTLGEVPIEDRRPFVAAYDKGLDLDLVAHELRLALRHGNDLSRSHSRLRSFSSTEEAAANRSLRQRKKYDTP